MFRTFLIFTSVGYGYGCSDVNCSNGRCNNGTCECFYGWKKNSMGKCIVLTDSNTSNLFHEKDCGHGTFDQNSNQCKCYRQYDKDDNGLCTLEKCKYGDLSSNSVCSCSFGYEKTFIKKVGTICKKDCGHGTFNIKTGYCDCRTGWRKSGFTNPISWVKGACNQFQCQSSSQCQDLTGFSHASCPIKNMNCRCGLLESIKTFGVGYQNYNASCASIIYESIYTGFDITFYSFKYLWRIFAFLIIICIPFGKFRTTCDHNRASIINYIVNFFRHNRCNGSCIEQTSVCTVFADNLAWSIYFFELCIWSYTMIIIINLIILLWWILLYLIGIFIVMVIIAIILIICACFSGADGCNGCNGCDGCNGCNGCDGCDGCNCCNSSTNCDCCYCCNHIDSSFNMFTEASGYTFMYFVSHIPLYPDNLWGGVFGYILGTNCFCLNHRQKQEQFKYFGYLGRVTRFSYLFGVSDLHSNEEWRQHILRITRSPVETVSNQLTAANRIIIRQNINNTVDVINLERKFELQDGCIQSSFEDYLKNECWICRDSKNTWHMWNTCGHMFCYECSNNMIERKIPCPNCRRVSHTIKQGTSVSPNV